MHAHIVFIANERRGNVGIRRVNSVKIEKSINKLIATGEVVLPRKISQFKTKQIKTLIRRGDQVEIWLGYNGRLQLELRGYVTAVSSDAPAKISVSDQMWWIAQWPVHKVYGSAYIPTVLRDVVPGYHEVDATEVTVGPVVFKRTTVGRALKLLNDEFGLRTFMKGDTVVCGKLHALESNTRKFAIERNVRDASNLTYRIADDISIKLIAKSVQANGDKLSVEIGDPQGETRELSYYNVESEAELRKLAEIDLEKYKYDGYQGSFSVYGEPYLEPGDKCELSSRQHPERNGTFAVEATAVTFDESPKYERKITLAQAL